MTSTVEIVSKEEVGNLIRVKLKVKSSEIFSVDGNKLDSPDRSSEYHLKLHSDRVNHRHNTRTAEETIWLNSPFSQNELDEKVASIVSDVNKTQVSNFDSTPAQIQERCFVGGANEKNFYTTDQAPQQLKDKLTTAFPTVDLSAIALISTASYHDILKQDVITTFRWEWDIPALMEGDVKLITKARKYCLSARKSYDRCYAFTDETFSFIPETCTIMAKSFHVNIQDGLVMPNFYDVYFSGDAAVVEEALTLPNLVGHENTYYGVTVVDGIVKRAKQSCYDKVSVFSNWDEAMARTASEHGLPWG